MLLKKRIAFKVFTRIYLLAYFKNERKELFNTHFSKGQINSWRRNFG